MTKDELLKASLEHATDVEFTRDDYTCRMPFESLKEAAANDEFALFHWYDTDGFSKWTCEIDDDRYWTYKSKPVKDLMKEARNE